MMCVEMFLCLPFCACDDRACTYEDVLWKRLVSRTLRQKLYKAPQRKSASIEEREICTDYRFERSRSVTTP